MGDEIRWEMRSDGRSDEMGDQMRSDQMRRETMSHFDVAAAYTIVKAEVT
jgi:hypothetical protein